VSDKGWATLVMAMLLGNVAMAFLGAMFTEYLCRKAFMRGYEAGLKDRDAERE